MMAMDEISFIVTTLERIQDKMEKQDNKIDMMVQALQQLVKVDTENQEIKSSLQRVFKRLEMVEANQNIDGCQAHKNFVVLRNEQLKKYDAITARLEETIIKMDARIKFIEDKPTVVMGKFGMAVIGALGAGFGGWLLLKFGVGK